MNKLTTSLITYYSASLIGIRDILLKIIIPGVLALFAYSTTSFADYTVWYDSETRQEHQIYNGSTLLTPPSWACGRKFTNPSYYRHLNTYHGTLDSDNFSKDVYVWIPKPGCPYTSEAVVEYTDGNQTFQPPVGAIAIEISTNDSSRWVNEDGGWPFFHNHSRSSDFTLETPKWDRIIGEIAILKLAIVNENMVKFDNAVLHIVPLMTSFEKEMTSSIRDASSKRSQEDQSRLKNIEEDALNQLSQARKQLDQCVSENESDSAYRSCDMVINNLHQFKSLWQSRD